MHFTKKRRFPARRSKSTEVAGCSELHRRKWLRILTRMMLMAYCMKELLISASSPTFTTCTRSTCSRQVRVKGDVQHVYPLFPRSVMRTHSLMSNAETSRGRGDEGAFYTNYFPEPLLGCCCGGEGKVASAVQPRTQGKRSDQFSLSIVGVGGHTLRGVR